jgi:hypothetical protein
MAYESFQKHLKEVKESTLFQQWSDSTTADAAGQKSYPIELLVLLGTTLRYLGRGWTLDDLEEATTISQETHFLHVYICWGSAVFYDKYVSMPSTADEIAASSSEFFIAGLAGCIGSSDATRIDMRSRCQYRLRHHHNYFKLPMPTRTYNITTNHRRRILSSTRGHPGRWNDKTLLVLYDELATDLRDGKRYDDLDFSLLERAEDGSVKSAVTQYRGA